MQQNALQPTSSFNLIKLLFSYQHSILVNPFQLVVKVKWEPGVSPCSSCENLTQTLVYKLITKRKHNKVYIILVNKKFACAAPAELSLKPVKQVLNFVTNRSSVIASSITAEQSHSLS